MAVSTGWIGAGVAALALSLPGSASAYTVKKTSTGNTVRWNRPAVTLRIDRSMYEYFTDLPVTSIVRAAAAAWDGLDDVPELLISEGEPGPLGFEEGAASNGVYLVKDWTLADSSLAVTVATFESASGRIVDTDILVNASHPFGLMADDPEGPADTFDLGAVFTHEMGHVLGLGESHDERMASMWPNIARGEIHQRDIDDDDANGAETAYAGMMASAMESHGGACGRASVALTPLRQGRGMNWIVAFCALAAGAFWLRRLRGSDARQVQRARGRTGLSLMAVGLLFAAPLTASGGDEESERVEIVRTLMLRRLSAAQRAEPMGKAVSSSHASVRLAAAGVLERVGVREELGLAVVLTDDADAEVRDAALRAMARLRTAPPQDHIAAHTPEAAERLAQLFRGASEVVAGEVVQAGAAERGGLIWSRFLVHGAEDVVAVELPGGSIGQFTQVVSEQELPDDGDRILMAKRPDGKTAWAHVRRGLLYGGWLGHGPAIEWPPSSR